MERIIIADTTLIQEESKYSFKEKIEIARQLEKLNVDVIELPEIINEKADILLVRTISSFVKNGVLSIGAGKTKESVDNAIKSLSFAKKGRIRIELPISPVGMEYICHKKAPKMLAWIEEIVSYAKENYQDVECSLEDATRADEGFIEKAINSAVKAGATSVTVCDTAGLLMPDCFGKMVANIAKDVQIPVGVMCSDNNGLAVANALMAVKNGAKCVKTSVCGDITSLDIFANMIKNCGESFGMEIAVKQTELHRIVKQISWITDNSKNIAKQVVAFMGDNSGLKLDANDDQDTVSQAVVKLGYELSQEDNVRVYEEFLKVAQKKGVVGAKELDAIVAIIAMQVPTTYKLISYVVNNGNVITSSAQLTVEKDGAKLHGVSIGNGPVEAAFLAIEQITSRHFELDDFQIQSVTEGNKALGQAVVKLRANGKLYSGNGLSTDIIGASIKAYLSAVNKIVYEEMDV